MLESVFEPVSERLGLPLDQVRVRVRSAAG